MPYTLTMGLIWFALAAMIGLVVGWVLRSAAASRQVARGRKQVQKELALEIDDLRERATTLGRAAEERDRLQAELESLKELQLALEGSPSGEVSTDSNNAVSEGDEGTDKVNATATPSLPDVALGSSVLGRRIVQDDLKAIVGIGPAIERLCHGVGIRTWWDLARAENDTLTTMLADAGPRFGRHDPSTWSEQAKRFAEGRWDEARAFEATIGEPQKR
jgi:predicted flap endonuclease-1-like 5' DNA nuclease